MTHRNRIIKAGALAVGAAFILPVLFGDRPAIPDRTGEDAWRNLIYDFQTLFGAALAIGAAWWTVNTMDRTELAAEKRHTDQMNLLLQKDRLAIERAVYPQIVSLNGIAFHLAQIRREILKKQTFEEQLSEIAEQSWKLNDIANDLIQLLDLEQLKEGSRLFDGMLAYKLTWLRARAEDIGNALNGLVQNIEFAIPISVLLADERVHDDLSHTVYGAVFQIADQVPAIVELMEMTASKYGVRQQH